MRIGIDLDDVLGDLVPSFASFHNRVYGSKFERTDFVSFSFSKVLKISEEETNIRLEAFYKSEEFRGIIPVFNSQKGVDTLRNLGHELVLISYRPSNVFEQTSSWLVEYFHEKFSAVFLIGSGSQRKRDICFALNIPLMVEDSLEHALDCTSLGTRVILYDTPWNQTNLGSMIRRAYSWGDIVNVVRNKGILFSRPKESD